MGRGSRERGRREQRRARWAAGGQSRTGPAGHWGGAGQSDPRAVESLLLAAAESIVRDDEAVRVELLGRLVSLAPAGDGPLLFDAALSRCLERAFAQAWERGWQPADVVRVVERRLGASHARVVAAAAVAEARRYPPSTVDSHWRSQLDELAGEATSCPNGRRGGDPPSREAEVRRDVETLSALLHLPELPRLCAPPGEATGAPTAASSTDARILGRVRALLAKAESTTFAVEAEALTAKAQELMARHAIDRAVLGAAGGGTGGPVGRRMGVDDPYAGAKALLLNEVAAANRCRSVWSSDVGFATVFGHDTDIAAVELLYTSLLVQADAAMGAAGRQVDGLGRSRTRSFRQSFLVAFASRIGARLRQTTTDTEAAAAEEHGAALLPVLAARIEAVDEACEATFPGLTRRSFSPSNRDGWFAGLAAAEMASLSAHQEMSRST